MKVSDLIQKINAAVLSGDGLDKELTGGLVCDLLSWAMANGKSGMAWVTVQTNINVVAVAALHDISCVILPAGIKMEGAPLEKALEENITVLSSPMSAYEICGILYQNGVR